MKWIRAGGSAMGAILLVAACSAFARVNCPEPADGAAPALECDVAIAAARTKLAGEMGVTTLTFGLGNYCPLGALCPLIADPGPTVGYVVAERGEDQPILVITIERRDDGSIKVSEPMSFDVP